MAMEHNVFWALTLTLMAGLSTGIGSAMGLFARLRSYRLLSFFMGFSAGVMIYISFVELFPRAKESLLLSLPEWDANFYLAISFFAGILTISLIDRFIPDFDNPHEFHSVVELEQNEEAKEYFKNKKLMRVGIFTAVAISIHNFPEGVATFISAVNDLTIGVPIAIAIALHNIPEGLAVSVPIYYATGSKKKAFIYSFSSGLAEPLGGLLAYLVLLPYLNDLVFGLIFGYISGIMVFISLDQLLPAAERYGEHHSSIYGMIAGMAIMATSLLII